MVMTLYSSMASESSELQNFPAVTAVLTSMAGAGAITSEAEGYTSSEDLMDISSYAPSPLASSSHQNAIPTSVITPTTSLANDWMISIHNSDGHGGFVPPPVSTASEGHFVGGIQRSAIPTSAIRSVPQHQQRVVMQTRDRMSTADMEFLRMSPSNSRRRIRDDELAPEEREKRKVRRERNKLAAAKCRQRRVDHTNALVQETEEWEEKNSTLEQEIQKLQQQKEQLQFILEAHKAMCKRNKVNKETTTCSTSTSTRKTVTLDTPSTEVVTPTSMFKFAPHETFGAEISSDVLPSPTCGQQVKRESTSSSDCLSSPEPSRTMIEL